MYVTLIMSEAPVMAEHFPEPVEGMRASMIVFDETGYGDTLPTSEEVIEGRVRGLAKSALNTLRIMGRIK